VKFSAYALLALVTAQSWSQQGSGAVALSDYAAEQTGAQQMPKNDQHVQKDSTTSPPQGTPQTDVVITPAGPVPKNKVYEVKPGEAVRQNDDGTITIVPNSKAK